jgi:CRP-like cAMP-binding protein
MEIHKQIYQEINFFKEKPMPFIAYVAPMLTEMNYQKDQYIFLEGEHINYIYFIVRGEAGFVLPRYNNTLYILIGQGDHFGLIDMLPYKEQDGKLVRQKSSHGNGEWDRKRQFTV